VGVYKIKKKKKKKKNGCRRIIHYS